MPSKFASCWIVTDGKAGMENQCLGLAESLKLDPIVKRISLKAPWRVLSPYLRLGLAHAFVGNASLEPPWPHVLIATGRQSIPASLYVRRESRRSGAITRTVQIQNPIIHPRHFDAVIAPLHDEISGPNVIVTIGALHRVTPERLRREAEILAPRLAHLPRPYAGVLIGGPNGVHRLGHAETAVLAQELVSLATRQKASLVITPSRRTGDENIAILRKALAGAPAFLWDGACPNPYYGILGLADYLLVTADSVNMISEASAAGPPLYIWDLPGGSQRAARFHRTMEAEGHARKYEGRMEAYPARPLDEMARVADEVARLF